MQTGRIARTALVFGFMALIVASAALSQKPAVPDTPGATAKKASSPPPAGAVEKAVAPTPAKPKFDTLIVTARLAEIPGKFAPNDLYNYVYIMQYRVLKVEKGVYSGQDILVGHYNPLIKRRAIKDKMDPFVDGDVVSFTVGDKHRLALIKPIESVWNDAVQDDYFDSELDKYFALRAEVVK